MEESAKPLYPFGYGLSYTQFEYNDLQVEAMSFQRRNVGRMESMADTLYKVSFTVKNVGPCDGDEVVQLYVRDEVASVTPASKLLKGFQRVHINKGETAELFFYLLSCDLSVYSAEKGWHVEAGEFTVIVGGNSDKNEIFLDFRVK